MTGGAPVDGQTLAANDPADGAKAAPAADRVVIVPCSGIGKAFGSIGREATYMVTEDLRPESTRTLCLSLLTMGDGDAQRLVREHATITIEGCPKACARVNVEASGGQPSAVFRVFDTFREHKDLKADGVSDIGENGRRLAEILAAEVAAKVDDLENGKE